LPPGTQWSQNPTDNFPAACGPWTKGGTNGIATTLAAAPCNTRRRVVLAMIASIIRAQASPVARASVLQLFVDFLQ
jgi:hypothetical protein